MASHLAQKFLWENEAHSLQIVCKVKKMSQVEAFSCKIVHILVGLEF